MYNKSAIMKAAWYEFKHGESATFSEALKKAWRNSKEMAAFAARQTDADRYFALQTTDRWTHEDRQTAIRLQSAVA